MIQCIIRYTLQFTKNTHKSATGNRMTYVSAFTNTKSDQPLPIRYINFNWWDAVVRHEIKSTRSLDSAIFPYIKNHTALRIPGTQP